MTPAIPQERRQAAIRIAVRLHVASRAPRHPLPTRINPQTGADQWSPEDFIERLKLFNRVNAVRDIPAPKRREP